MEYMANRKVWFVPRPLRDPQYHKDALAALAKVTNNFSLCWQGNRDLQKEYEKELAKEGWKADHISTSGSGGRTWAAMLRVYNYVYLKPNGCFKLTKVGAALLAGIKVRENVSKQLLTFQIPNPYFMSGAFRPRFEDGFSIRPVRFLLKLVNQEALNYSVSKEEIIFFAMKAKKDSDLVKTTAEIIQYRKADAKAKEEIRIQIADQYDYRERKDKGARVYNEAVGDVATTLMLICKYIGFVEYAYGANGSLATLSVPKENRQPLALFIAKYDDRYPFNARYLISDESFGENNGLDVDSYKAPKAESVATASSSSKLTNKAKKIIEAHPEVDPSNETDVKKLLKTTSEFDDDTICKILESLDLSAQPQLSDVFAKSYLEETDPHEFEVKTAQLLKVFGLTVEYEPDPVLMRGPRIELAVSAGGLHLGLIDCKLYKKKFSLSSSLADYMGTEYIPDYEGFGGMKVEYFGYVTSKGFSGEQNLGKATAAAKLAIPGRAIKGFIIDAKTLLAMADFCVTNQLPDDVRQKIFANLATNAGYRSLSDIAGLITD